MYVVRELSPTRWEVAKFGDKREPLAVYRVEKDGARWKCSCPVGKRCKHIDRVKVWIYVEDKQLPEYLGARTIEELAENLSRRLEDGRKR